MRVYMAGPVTGVPDGNKPLFAKTAEYLDMAGYEAINPHDIPMPSIVTWERAMKLCIMELIRCDKIAMLPGWENSRGARLEHYIANALDIKPIYMNIYGGSNGQST